MRFPLPHWCIWDAQCLETVPAPVHRAASLLAVAYWRGGCTGLPSDDTTLAILAKLPLQHWAPLKAAVMPALAKIMPALDREHAVCTAKHERKVKSGHRLTAARRAMRARNAESARSGDVAHSLPVREVPADVPKAFMLGRGDDVAYAREKQRTRAPGGFTD